jgi:hypothetical protein
LYVWHVEILRENISRRGKKKKENIIGFDVLKWLAKL